MVAEFEKRLNQLTVEETTKRNILELIDSAGKEFPCLSCPSKDECGSFKWFLKWYGAPKETE